MKKLYVDNKKQFWLKSIQEEDGSWCFERMADVSSDYGLPKMFVLEEQCEFFNENNKEEVNKLKEFDKGYEGWTYPSGEGGNVGSSPTGGIFIIINITLPHDRIRPSATWG